jgi:hypothetical protein
LIASAEPAFAAHLQAIEGFAAALLAIGGEPPPAPRWNQDWFPRLDAAAAYAMVRRQRPARIVEIGSGHSTRFLARAVADGALATRITAIDPQPRAALAGLDVERISRKVQEAEPRIFEGVDLLFIDSSHKLEPGSDVELILERALPALAPGALVHFHDIFLPHDYPAHWAWRNYSEQPAVAALIESGRYVPVFASAWVVAQRPAWLVRGVLARLPLVPGAIESSLWLRKTG